jgi:hypothetical protein
MKYLENEICDFQILTKYDKTKKYNVLSACFFKMETHYKNFSVYVNKIKKILDYIKNQKKYVLRIFIDDNIRNDKYVFNLLSNTKNVQIVLFKCSEYMKNNYHIDVFGSLVRLFPIFDFENNDTNDVIVIDIDLNNEDMTKLISLMNYSTDTKEIACMGTTQNVLIMKEQPHAFCGLFGVFKQKYDKNIIVDFIKSAHLIKDKGLYNERTTPFGFGVDELFLNKYFLYNEKNLLIKNVKIGMIFQYNIFYFLYYYKEELKVEKYNESYTNLKYILGKYGESVVSVDELFLLLDKLTYGVSSYDEKKLYVSKRFYELIDRLYKSKKEWFSFENITLIKKYFFNIVDCVAVIYFDKLNFQIYDVTILKENVIKNK